MKPPFETGQTLRLDISGLISDGRGLARHDSVAVFVDEALPGQTVLARIRTVKRRLVEAESLSVLIPAPNARPAPCPHNADCGGCSWQAMPYAAQLEWKSQFVVDALRRIGKVAGPPMLPILASPEEWGYRNKMEFSVRGTEVGLRRRSSHGIVPVTGCLLQSALTMRLVASARKAFQHMDATLWRYLVIREPRAGGCLAEVIVAPHPDAVPLGQRLAEALFRDCPELDGFILSERANPPDIAYGERTLWYQGKTELQERLGPASFALGEGAFFQVNTLAAERLYAEVSRLAAEGPLDRVWDLYCGVGSIGLYVALHTPVRHLRGVEQSAQAVALARLNARTLAPDLDCAFQVGDAATLPSVGKAARCGERPDLVIMDPPRTGVDSRLLEALKDLRPERILYVSCDPATLARDIERLHGYVLKTARPVDLFPQTPHVESVCLLERLD